MSEPGRLQAGEVAAPPGGGGPAVLADIALGCIGLLPLPDPAPGEGGEERLYLEQLRARLPGGGHQDTRAS